MEPEKDKSVTGKRVSDKDLRRSVQLLDDALNSPVKSTLRISKSNLLKSSVLRRKRESLADRSVSKAFGDVPSKSPKYDISGINESTNLWDEVTAELSCAVSVGQEPWKVAVDDLFTEFLQSMRTHGTERQIFDTVQDFIENCSSALDLLKEIEYKMTKGSGFQNKVKWLVNERETWCLIYALYKDRLTNEPNSLENGGKLQPIVSHQLSEKEVVVEFYKNDNCVRECQLVLDWLEQNAVQQEEEKFNIEHYTDKTVAWENTLHQLKNEPLHIPYASSRTIINKLDPDAPLRERKPLHDLDMEDETKLIKAVFTEIRCGRLDEAQRLCLHCGQPWRAAVLEGWRLFHDPNYGNSPSNTGEKLPIEGNPHRDLWKLMAWRLAGDPQIPAYTRASHAAFCGHFEALENVCETWSDLLWAYLKVMVDIRVEKEIRASVLRSYISMPDEYWQNMLALEDIFTKLGANKKKEVSSSALNPDHVIQKYIILNQIPLLMDAMLEWSGTADAQFLRFMAHLVLFFRYIGHSEQDDIGDAILEAYVKVLMQMGDPQLVACYVATLPQEDQINLYAQFLENVIEESDRLSCLTAAEDAGLDVESVTKRVFEIIRNQEVSDQLTSFHVHATPDDLKKVSALDWLTFYPSQRSEALYQANAVIRQFLILEKLEAARKAFNKIPIDSINIIISENRPGDRIENFEHFDTESLPSRIGSSIREYLCHRTYLDAQEGFSDWFHHFHNAKPIAPTLPAGEVGFTEKVAFDHRNNQFKMEMERWKLAMQQQTKMVKSQLYNVLTFPGGWMVDVRRGPEEEEGPLDDESRWRQQHMEWLRKLCIPKIVLLLVSMLQSMGEHTECIQLTELIAAERHQLYEVYSREDLQELLRKIGESSLDLMKNKRDAWGNPITF